MVNFIKSGFFNSDFDIWKQIYHINLYKFIWFNLQTQKNLETEIFKLVQLVIVCF